MTIKIAINGFGRIGATALRAIIQHFPDMGVIAINGVADPHYLLYKLKYDSVQGILNYPITAEGNTLVLNGKKIRLTAIRNLDEINWHGLDIDVVLECTGQFLTIDTCKKHILAGAKRVIQSAPPKDDTPMYIFGANHLNYQQESVISASSCTTNALAPLVKIIHGHFGIRRGLMTTIHATTASQNTVDGSSHKDWRAGRGILDNIIPASTGAAKSIGKIIPELNKKLTGMAFRVPTADVSVIDLTCELQKEASYDEIVKIVEAVSQQKDMMEVLGFSRDQIVSKDLLGTTYATVFDALAGIALDETFVKLVAWYDNEYGYTCNLLRLARYIANK